jgi:hypothetical protein
MQHLPTLGEGAKTNRTFLKGISSLFWLVFRENPNPPTTIRCMYPRLSTRRLPILTAYNRPFYLPIFIPLPTTKAKILWAKISREQSLGPPAPPQPQIYPSWETMKSKTWAPRWSPPLTSVVPPIRCVCSQSNCLAPPQSCRFSRGFSYPLIPSLLTPKILPNSPQTQRGCTDILCLLLIVAHWAAMTGKFHPQTCQSSKVVSTFPLLTSKP